MYYKQDIIFKNTYITSVNVNGSTSNMLRKKKSNFFHYSGKFYFEAFYIYEDFKIDLKKISINLIDFLLNFFLYINITFYNNFNSDIDLFLEKTNQLDCSSFIEDDVINNFFIQNHINLYNHTLNKDIFFY